MDWSPISQLLVSPEMSHLRSPGTAGSGGPSLSQHVQHLQHKLTEKNTTMMATTRLHCSTCLLTFNTINDIRHAISYFLPELQLANEP
jgi:hypothetical protein